MIEPTGTPVDVLGVKNNQSSKAPNGGMGTRQTTDADGSMEKAHDDMSYGQVGTGGIADNVPGNTRREDKCLTQAQDSGAVPFSVGAAVNVGAPGWSGTKDIPMEAVTGFNTAGGRNQIKLAETKADPGSDKDIGVAPGMLFPGIIE